MISIKTLAESPGLTSIPHNYIIARNSHDDEQILDSDTTKHSIPIIDFSLLTSSQPDQRSRIVQDLGKACQEWGFFMVTNHVVPEKVIKAMIDGCKSFFDLPEEEKRKFQGGNVLDPIRYGTSFNSSVDKVMFWKDYIKMFVHPEFHSPDKPVEFKETLKEYCKSVRKVTMELLKGVSESLGLESNYIETTMDLNNGKQLLASNLYPPCPQPELAMGFGPHSDHGLLTLLVQNEIGGLQVQHDGNWVDVDPLPNCFLVNTGDHTEILSNGKYKSVVHRAMVNNKATRISIASAFGPSLDTVVSPAKALINNESPQAYIGMTYRNYFKLQQSNNIDGKSALDRVRCSID
ncbi:hypothetical protein ACFE04_023931 [Oxalis oulophora]